MAIVLLITDIAINLNTAYFYKGEPIYHRKKIYEFWLKNDAIYDVLSQVPWLVEIFFEYYSFPL